MTFTLRSVLKNVTVEPLFFLFLFGADMYWTITSSALYFKICRQNFRHLHDVDCHRLFENPVIETKVQQLTAYWQLYIALAYVFPLLIAGPTWGAFGDRYGRKVTIMFGLTGFILSALIHLTEFVYADTMSLIWLPLTGVFIACTGFIGTIYTSIYAYVADRVNDRLSLTTRFTVLQLTGDVAFILGGYSSSFLLSRISINTAMIFPQVLWTLSFLLAVICLKQEAPKQTRKNIAEADGAKPGALLTSKNSLYSLSQNAHTIRDATGAEKGSETYRRNVAESEAVPDPVRTTISTSSITSTTALQSVLLYSDSEQSLFDTKLAQGNPVKSQCNGSGSGPGSKSRSRIRDEPESTATDVNHNLTGDANGQIMEPVEIEEEGEEDCALLISGDKLISKCAQPSSANVNNRRLLRFGWLKSTKPRKTQPINGELNGSFQLITKRVALNEPIRDEQIVEQDNVVSATIKLLISSARAIVRSRKGRFRCYIWVTFVSFFWMNTTHVGMGQAFSLFVFHPPISGSPAELGAFKGFEHAMRLLGNLLNIVLLKGLACHETTIILLSNFSMLLRLCFIGTSHSWHGVYASGIFGAASSLVYPCTKSLICQFIHPDEIGRVYALLQLAMDAGYLFAITVFNVIYAETVGFFPGLLFLITAGILLMSMVPMIWLHWDYRRFRLHGAGGPVRYQPVQTEAEDDDEFVIEMSDP